MIDEYGRGYGLLAAAVAEIPREAWTFKPAADEWSVHEILVHMGDSESMAALRLRKLVVEPRTTLMAYDESAWAGALNYKDQSAEDALQIIRLARQTTYRLLKSLPESVFEHSVTHPEMSDPYTFDTWLGIYARHIPDHLDQMRRAYEAFKKK
jgi:uncharacterized damage-inducible protein DinB